MKQIDFQDVKQRIVSDKAIQIFENKEFKFKLEQEFLSVNIIKEFDK